jgi:polysaccharide export outer membrane protein
MARGVLLALCFALACAGVARAQVDGSGVYRIQPGDVLSVAVLEDPGLNQTLLVRPDGRISMPIAGTIAVEGLSPEEAQAVIRRNLARDFVQPPTVTVALQSASEETPGLIEVFVLGEVARPGPYEVEAPIELLQLLAVAGGPSPFAATRRIQLRRRGETGDAVVFFDYQNVEDGLVPVDRLMLQDGDVVVVPQRRLFE